MTHDNTRHTPTPWALSYGYAVPGGMRIYVAGPEPKQIGIKLMSPYIEGAWDGDPEAEANARHIVKVVNCHDELLAAANEAFDFLGGVDGAAEVRGTLLTAILKATGSGSSHG